MLDEQGNITNDFSYVVVNLSVKNQSSKTIVNHNYYAETFAPEEEKVMPMIFVVNDALLDSEAMYLEINPTGAVIDNPDYDIRRYIVLN